MDEYVPGLISDIISGKQNCKLTSKSSKKKESYSVISNNTSNPINQSEKKNKSEITNSQNESLLRKKLSNKEGQAKESISNKKLSPLAKKIRKNSELNSNNTKENLEIELSLSNSVPNDSEEEKAEKVVKNSKCEVKNKQKTFSDFKENTVFVGNIPITYDKHKICKIFSRFGDIQSARIRCVPIADINISKKVAAIKKKFNPKRQSAVAYVKYKSQDSAKAALQANGMVIDGHHLRVDLAQENKERNNNKAIFVGGLPFDIEDDELWEFFEKCGKINSVRIIRDSQTSMGKGFGYVNFDSTASVELALQLDGQELKKRHINVKRCTKGRNKNKVNSFGKKKSTEITSTLLCKKGKKFKEERKKKKEKEKFERGEFQGRTANMKQKKRKKLSQSARRQKKLVKILAAT